MNSQMTIQRLISSINSDWKTVLNQIYHTSTTSTTSTTNDLFMLLNKIIQNGKISMYPPPPLIFYAFNHFNQDELKVVILGQDPYHQKNQAMGLAFSVFKSEKNPPSLRNIMKEIGTNYPNSNINKEEGDLTYLVHQGVLLLNSSLTVFDSKAGCHLKHWETFTDAIIKHISMSRRDIVFMLWGNYARGKKTMIDEEKHCILESSHPSPLSAHRGFLGCQHFIKCNQYLEQHHKIPVEW